MSQIDIIKDTIAKLEALRETIRQESTGWWWLDQGDAPIFEISDVEIEENKIRSITRRKMSVKVAIPKIIDLLKKSLTMKSNERTKLVRIIENNLMNITNIIWGIKEAHDIIENLHGMLNQLEKMEQTEEVEKLRKIARGSIDWIKEIFYTNPREWENRRKMFKNVVEKLRRDISNLN